MTGSKEDYIIISNMKKIYITTAIPYVNAAPHVGHALEFVQADTIARFFRNLCDEVALLSGGDQNALKKLQASEDASEDVQKFVDKHTELFRQLADKLNVQFDFFQKGSDKVHHYPSSQKLWELCEKAGDIYKKSYKGLYCVGCEMFYAPDELDSNGECFNHPGKKLAEVEEENYFFRLSKYKDKIIKLIKSGEYEIVPNTKKNEMLSFLSGELQDISISRSNERAKNWGVPVPGDSSQRMYVWFDALNIYQSGIGFGWDNNLYNKWWPADVHIIGKDIVRFHAIYWPAFLLSAGLKLPKRLFVHGFFTIDGQKMSKSLGNVIDPFDLVEKYGVEAIRFYLLREIPAWGDGDFSISRFRDLYNGELANGLGNLVARVARLASDTSLSLPPKKNFAFKKVVLENLKNFRFDHALIGLWEEISALDKRINDEKPWTLEGAELKKSITPIAQQIREIAFNLGPFLPETSQKILDQFTGRVTAEKPLFPRI